MMKAFLILEAYLRLITHDWYMTRHPFRDLCGKLRDLPVRSKADRWPSISDLSLALDIACTFYPKPVLCLEHAAVLLAMLRARGIEAELIIGTQILPFKAHAWVRVEGKVIGDRLACRELFEILEVL